CDQRHRRPWPLPAARQQTARAHERSYGLEMDPDGTPTLASAWPCRHSWGEEEALPRITRIYADLRGSGRGQRRHQAPHWLLHSRGFQRAGGDGPWAMYLPWADPRKSAQSAQIRGKSFRSTTHGRSDSLGSAPG